MLAAVSIWLAMTFASAAPAAAPADAPSFEAPTPAAPAARKRSGLRDPFGPKPPARIPPGTLPATAPLHDPFDADRLNRSLPTTASSVRAPFGE
ncbi:MAG: hypothetical protein AAGA54_04210 [Myxococcota bacterium]